MTAGLVPLAIVGIVGLAIGIWFGLPGRDRPSVEDIERSMDQGGGTARRRHSKRAINPLAWVQRRSQAKPSRARRSARTSAKRGFSLESPDDRD